MKELAGHLSLVTDSLLSTWQKRVKYLGVTCSLHFLIISHLEGH